MPIWVRQAAAIPVRDDRVCLVTSSSGRRWVVPKGQIDPGHTAGEAALVEAWEEAGLVGALDPEPLGSYAYEKLGRELLVLVYRLTVTEVRDEWPERQLRAREWVTLAEALDRIEEPGLRDLLRVAFHIKRPDRLTLATA
ncbi:MAG: NUDIX hydrolase [Planctomycetes bacterium]|nr:NUDIX hydrolase [Planctomycetota bacterium]